MTEDGPETEVYDRVLETAADRPAVDSLPDVPDPACDHGDVDRKRRRDDVELKHQRIRDFLDRTNQDAVVLGRADSIAWFTSGGDLAQDYGSDNSSVLLYINRNSRAVLADNVQSSRVFEEELAGLGFQLKERPWYDDPLRVVAELCHNKKIATDLASEGCSQWRRALDPLRDLRRQLTPLERQRYRELGRTLSLAVEATCRNFDRGEREADVAGHLAHRLIREGVAPVDLRVASDDRLARYRQPTFKAAPILKKATIAVTGRRHGLCASVTRTVTFGPPETEFRANHTLAAMVDATCIYFSRPGEPIAEVFRRARRIYEKYDAPHEWTLDYQGVLIGYSPREALLTPDSPMILEPNMAVCWNPSVGSARSEDTIVVDSRGFDIVTAAQDWPLIDISVKGYSLPRPGILER
nr:aminopeptidase P family protein [Paludisphaera mucosa]